LELLGGNTIDDSPHATKRASLLVGWSSLALIREMTLSRIEHARECAAGRTVSFKIDRSAALQGRGPTRQPRGWRADVVSVFLRKTSGRAGGPHTVRLKPDATYFSKTL